MPTLKRLCDAPGCGELSVRASKYCVRCKAKSIARARLAEKKRPSAARRGYNDKWRMIRANYLRRNPNCEICGKPATEVDHIKPLSEGGTHRSENLRALDKSCHSRITANYFRGSDGRFGGR